jgi:hypothetical protein
MKLCREELRIIKDLLADKLDNLCTPTVPHNTGAKELAYLALDNFENESSDNIKWYQIILRKIIAEMVDMNGN